MQWVVLDYLVVRQHAAPCYSAMTISALYSSCPQAPRVSVMDFAGAAARSRAVPGDDAMDLDEERW
jgi:hypothetical protein